MRPIFPAEKDKGESECVSFPASGEVTITNEKGRSIDFEYDYVARQDCGQVRAPPFSCCLSLSLCCCFRHLLIKVVGQVEIYKEVRAVAQSVLDGYNCCIFACKTLDT